MSTNSKPPASRPHDSSEGPVERTPLNVTLPPIDAEPEEIAKALVRETPPQRQEVKESDDS